MTKRGLRAGEGERSEARDTWMDGVRGTRSFGTGVVGVWVEKGWCRFVGKAVGRSHTEAMNQGNDTHS